MVVFQLRNHADVTDDESPAQGLHAVQDPVLSLPEAFGRCPGVILRKDCDVMDCRGVSSKSFSLVQRWPVSRCSLPVASSPGRSLQTETTDVLHS